MTANKPRDLTKVEDALKRAARTAISGSRDARSGRLTVMRAPRSNAVHLTIETEREDDGRWIAEVPELPGVLTYGATEGEAAVKAEALALRVVADRLEHGEAKPQDVTIRVQAAE